MDLSKLLFLNFDSVKLPTVAIWLWWIVIAASLFSITLAIDSPQLIFTLYGCSLFIVIMSFALWV